jgi:hypothetical protein
MDRLSRPPASDNQYVRLAHPQDLADVPADDRAAPVEHLALRFGRSCGGQLGSLEENYLGQRFYGLLARAEDRYLAHKRTRDQFRLGERAPRVGGHAERGLGFVLAEPRRRVGDHRGRADAAQSRAAGARDSGESKRGGEL